MSRPPALKITKALLTKVERLAARGLTQDQIAVSLGISSTTLYKNKAKYAEFADAIKKGQSKGLEQVSNALFSKAVKGDTTAQIFYLKNRDPENWKDRKDINQETTITDRRTYNDLTPEQKKAVQEVRRKLDDSSRVTH